MANSTVQCRDILVDEGGYNPGGNLHIGREPSSPSNVVTLFDTPDRGPFLGAERNPSTRYVYDGVQARIRNIKYDEGMEVANSIVDLLHQRGNEYIGGVYVALIEALDNPFLLEWDSNDRAKIVVNFSVQKKVEIET